MCNTCRKESNVVEEGVVDLEAVERVHASVIKGANEDVLVAIAAQAQPFTISRYNTSTKWSVRHLLLPQDSHMQYTKYSNSTPCSGSSGSQPEEVEVQNGLPVIPQCVSNIGNGSANLRQILALNNIEFDGLQNMQAG